MLTGAPFALIKADFSALQYTRRPVTIDASKPCEQCFGTGRLPVPTPYTRSKDERHVPCEFCFGTGRFLTATAVAKPS